MFVALAFSRAVGRRSLTRFSTRIHSLPSNSNP